MPRRYDSDLGTCDPRANAVAKHRCRASSVVCMGRRAWFVFDGARKSERAANRPCPNRQAADPCHARKGRSCRFPPSPLPLTPLGPDEI